MSSKNELAAAKKSEVIDLAKTQIPGLQKSIGAITGNDKFDHTLYVANLPEGLNAEIAAQVHRADTQFVATAAAAYQGQAVSLFAKKDSPTSATGMFDMTGGMDLKVAVQQSVERPQMVGADGNVISEGGTSWAATTARVSLPVSGTKTLLKEGSAAAEEKLK